MTAAHCFASKSDHEIYNDVMAYVGLLYGCRPQNNFTTGEYRDRKMLRDVKIHPKYEPKPVVDVGEE